MRKRRLETDAASLLKNGAAGREEAGLTAGMRARVSARSAAAREEAAQSTAIASVGNNHPWRRAAP